MLPIEALIEGLAAALGAAMSRTAFRVVRRPEGGAAADDAMHVHVRLAEIGDKEAARDMCQLLEWF